MSLGHKASELDGNEDLLDEDAPGSHRTITTAYDLEVLHGFTLAPPARRRALHRRRSVAARTVLLVLVASSLVALAIMGAGWVIALQAFQRPKSVSLVPVISIKANGLVKGVPFVDLYAPSDPADIAPPSVPGTWKLAFDDEFDQSSLSETNWSTCYAWACTNNGSLETEDYSPTGISVANGTADLTARPVVGQKKPFVSGMLSSDGHFSFTYGYAEIRVHLPSGKGLWPAFWLLPTNETWPPEIDVFEFWGANPTQMMMAVHYGEDERLNHVFTDDELTAGYHTFAIDWEPHKITWYIDNKERFSADVSVDTPMYLIANLATLGTPQQDHATSFPASLNIDYIRVFVNSSSRVLR